MKKLLSSWLVLLNLLLPVAALADDTCVFGVSTNDVPSVVVILLDNGANMQHIAWHDAYDNSIDYTPAGVGVFTNSHGYALEISGNDYVLNPIQADLSISNAGGIQASVSKKPTFEINSRKVTLPAAPSSSPDADNVKDNAGTFRYSTNYLNWIFYSAGWTTAGKPGEDVIEPYGQADGASLPARSRFYYAKKAIFTLSKMANNKALFALYSFNSNSNGASNVQPIKEVAQEPLAADPANNSLDSAWVSNINNLGTFTYSPLAEGMASVGAYFNSSNSGLKDFPACTKLFVIVVTPGLSSEDGIPGNQDVPGVLGDLDGDGAAGGIGEGRIKWGTEAGGYNLAQIPVGLNGTTELDDAAHYLYKNQIGTPYKQNVMTYTVGFMAEEASRRFLINTSNNGNGISNLYDTSNPDYGKYHFDATSPDGLATALIEALNSILERTNAFAAPVVPVTRTTSGNRLYMSFFTPKNNTNFWVGNVVKFELDSNFIIIDKNGVPATEANGALKETAEPFWSTINWASSGFPNYMANGVRKIYTFMGTDADLTDATNKFDIDNAGLTAAVLGNPADHQKIINYIRGADVFDEDADGNLGENRAVITGDVLHSEPVVYEYIYASGTLELNGVDGDFQDNEIIRGRSGAYALANGTTYSGDSKLDYDGLKAPFAAGESIRGMTSGATAIVASVPDDKTRIFFGANDGMLHAVKDEDGKEAWGFIPPDQLPRLKEIVEGIGHQYFIDASAKILLVEGAAPDGILDAGEQVVLIFGERKGGHHYFALDVTDPDAPSYLWQTGFALGETWSEPVFGKVKTSDDDVTGTEVFFVGGGYDPAGGLGRAVYAIKVADGTVLRQLTHASMVYPVASTVTALDMDSDGFTDVVYVGDTGGQLWRLGKFDSADFSFHDENINHWDTALLFDAGCNEADCTDTVDNNGNGQTDEKRKFFYAPTVTREVGYDLILGGTGDRENPCETTLIGDLVFAVKDIHAQAPALLTTTDLKDAATVLNPALDGADNGWYRLLSAGEKVLGETTVFFKIFYFTTFKPNANPCQPGGEARLYGVNYKTGQGVLPSGDTVVTSICIGGGIPSKPVMVLGDSGQEMFVSVGSTISVDSTSNTDAGVTTFDPTGDDFNFHYKWWQELF